jgi:hypothetical protein
MSFVERSWSLRTGSMGIGLGPREKLARPLSSVLVCMLVLIA